MKPLFIFYYLSLILSVNIINAQDTISKPYSEVEISVNNNIDGTLLQLNENTDNLAILIAGSGPTDRDGNQTFMKTDMLKKLAYKLAENNINSYRYDKRIVKQIKNGTIDKNISFNDFVTDAKAVLAHFSSKNKFKNIYIIGHSQGALIALLAANDAVSGVISLSGVAKPIDEIIEYQIKTNAPQFETEVKAVFNELKAGKTTTKYPPALNSIFNLDTQKFLISWMAYNPTEVIKTINAPILIINGTNDLQVSIEEGEQLAEANKKAEFKAITNMNHVLVEVPAEDRLTNAKTYNEPNKPLSETLIQELVDFIKK